MLLLPPIHIPHMPSLKKKERKLCVQKAHSLHQLRKRVHRGSSLLRRNQLASHGDAWPLAGWPVLQGSKPESRKVSIN